MAEIIKPPGMYEILTPQDVIDYQYELIEIHARTCYWSEKGDITPVSGQEMMRRLIKKGHFSQIEPGHLSVKFTGVSIGFSRENNRHRRYTVSERSTRYVDYQKGEENLDKFQLRFVAPKHRDLDQAVDVGDGRQMTAREMFNEEEKFYRALRRAGWKPEDARQILPLGTETEETITADYREWRHVFELRTGRPAHWEIREVMGLLLEDVRARIPGLVDDFEKVGEDNNGIPHYRNKYKDE